MDLLGVKYILQVKRKQNAPLKPEKAENQEKKNKQLYTKRWQLEALILNKLHQ